MKVIQKAFKIKLEPNLDQQIQINKTIGSARFVYNHFLALKNLLYTTEKKSISYEKCSNQLTILKKEIEWLADVDKFSLQNSLKNLDIAYQNFFNSIKGKRKGKKMGFPKFKKKNKSKLSYKTNFTNNNIEIRENYIKLPKLKWVKFNKSQEITGKIINVTIELTRSGSYVASVLCETEIEQYADSDKEIGIDLGIKKYVITTDSLENSEEVDNPKSYRNNLKKLKRIQKRLSRKQKESKNRAKVRIKLARIYEKITNIRNDFLHKLSTKIIKENGVICIENLKVSNMIKNHKLALSIQDAAWGKFVDMLEYKANWNDRIIQKVPTFYPSSQICNNCESINSEIKDLSIREWECPVCKVNHNRDQNAAKNILKEGKRLLENTVGTTEINASGQIDLCLLNENSINKLTG